jgi:CheY-like chemotaxis protein
MEDEEILRETLQVALEASGYSVESADNGATAVAQYEEAQAEGRPFAAALLDLTVRGNLGGIETIKRLRQLDPQVKAIVMSGHTESNALRQFAEHGFSGCLPKPFEFGNLLRLLDKITKP